MLSPCVIAVAVLGVIVALHLLFELHYFTRSLLTVVVCLFCKKKRHVLDTLSVRGICLTSDIDVLLYHMNNARYLREVDFARIDFYQRTGLLGHISAKGGGVVQGAATIRYRRFIRPFTIFRIDTRVIYWDSTSLFMEHRFVTPKDNFVRAIAVCRQRLIDCNAEEIMTDLLSRPEPKMANQLAGVSNPSAVIEMEPEDKDNKMHTVVLDPVKPNMPPGKPDLPLEVAKWLESIEISSANLRNGC
ncbi:hypothetical protein ONE63_006833 [Megalurothrips usitatus]|uniref:Protein THEM6 n=1 Tax=Megalurothrips usitatus TaxID=439358 RepID=A0AAV7XV05_9NEOP|nr:hypothetical protein ONE63_006833 [Megalurothrips usitatus]